ncbi:MAG TPA: hypothetical protein VL422_01050 [Miltoncostaea sp.]|nr:hypothetical protein [Miltoncostaea sp.]
MADSPPPEHIVRELMEVHGYRPVSRPGRWYSSARGRIRAAAWTGLGALIVLVGPATAVFALSETAGLALALPAAAVLFLCMVAIYVDALSGAQPGADDEAERAVARMVSGRGVSRRD